MLKTVDGRTPESLVYYYLTHEPSAQVSYKVSRRQQNHQKLPSMQRSVANSPTVVSSMGQLQWQTPQQLQPLWDQLQWQTPQQLHPLWSFIPLLVVRQKPGYKIDIISCPLSH